MNNTAHTSSLNYFRFYSVERVKVGLPQVYLINEYMCHASPLNDHTLSEPTNINLIRVTLKVYWQAALSISLLPWVRLLQSLYSTQDNGHASDFRYLGWTCLTDFRYLGWTCHDWVTMYMWYTSNYFETIVHNLKNDKQKWLNFIYSNFTAPLSLRERK